MCSKNWFLSRMHVDKPNMSWTTFNEQFPDIHHMFHTMIRAIQSKTQQRAYNNERLDYVLWTVKTYRYIIAEMFPTCELSAGIIHVHNIYRTGMCQNIHVYITSWGYMLSSAIFKYYQNWVFMGSKKLHPVLRTATPPQKMWITTLAYQQNCWHKWAKK